MPTCLIMQESWEPDDGGPSTADRVAGQLGYSVVAEVGLAHGRLFDPRPTASTRWGPPVRPWRGSFRLDEEHWRRGPDTNGATFVSGTWGLAMLSRLPVHHGTVIPLPKLRRDAARRVVIGGTVELAGGVLAVFGTHMSHITHGSHAQYRRLSDLLPPPTDAAAAGRGHEPVGPTRSTPTSGDGGGPSPPGPGPPTGPTASSTTCWSPRPCRCSTPGPEGSPGPTTGRWWPPWP